MKFKEWNNKIIVDLIVENELIKQRISDLVSENVKLQNDLFTEQLIQDETEDYINQLKQELFNLYLKHYNYINAYKFVQQLDKPEEKENR